MEKVGEIIEKNKVIIGSFLILAIVAGGGVLLWRQNGATSADQKLLELEGKMKMLEEEKESLDQNKVAEVVPTVTPTGEVAGANNQTTDGILKQVQDDKKVSGKININTATASELDSLPGIGSTYAGRIIEYRNAHGGFKSIAEIKNVKGIGDKTFEKFKDQISI